MAFQPGNQLAKKKPNDIDILESGLIKIFLTQNKWVVVNINDYGRIKGYHWCAMKNSGNWYAMTHIPKLGGGHKTKYMHQLLLPVDTEWEVDHIDGDGLNNRMSNLRRVNRQQNSMNRDIRKDSTSKIKGVYWHKSSGKWQSNIMIKGESIHLGLFLSIDDAISARKAAEVKYFGEFSRADCK